MAKRTSKISHRRDTAPAPREGAGISARDIAIGAAGLAAVLAVVYAVKNNLHAKSEKSREMKNMLGSVADQLGVTKKTGVDIGRYIGETFLGPIIGTLIDAMIGGRSQGHGKDEEEA